MRTAICPFRRLDGGRNVVVKEERSNTICHNVIVLVHLKIFNKLEKALGDVMLSTSQFEACSASIATRSTNLIGIYESDNGRKGE